MKKNFSLIQITSALIISIITLSIVSCSKKDDKELELPRQFKPGDINITTEPTRALLQWSPSLFTDSATSYTVQVSKDSTFAAGVLTTTVNKPGVYITDSFLQVRQSYFARVKANSLGSRTESGWVNSSKFSISGEQVFLSLSAS